MKRAARLVIVFVVMCQVMYAPLAMAVEEEGIQPEAPASGVTDTTAVSPMQQNLLPPPLISSPPPEEPLPVSQPQQLAEPTPEPPTVLPPLIINRIVAGITGFTAYEYIELHNPNPTDVFIDTWRLAILRKEGDVKQEISLHGTVKANSSMVIAGTDSALDSLNPDVRLKSNVIVTTGGIVQLSDKTNTIIERLGWGDVTTPSLALPTGTALERRYTSAIPSLTGDTLQDFVSTSITTPPPGGGFVPYVAPINRCTGIIISEIAANMPDDSQFIELYNNANIPVSLDQCLLQTNRSTTKSFALSGTLNPGEYRATAVKDTGLDLTKTTAGTVYLLSSDGKEEIDTRAYDGLASNTSWAWFGGQEWRQTFSPSPNAANAWQEFRACEAGYERNVETGRCRKLTTTQEATLIDCGSGKYRSPETNRCRNVASTATLAACKAGQIRNLETNRCRSVATAANMLMPCKEGQERNPATNRCRNVAKAPPSAAFAVEPVKDNSSTFAGWWALGAIGALAIGYGVWEWRRELWNGLQKLGALFTIHK